MLEPSQNDWTKPKQLASQKDVASRKKTAKLNKLRSTGKLIHVIKQVDIYLTCNTSGNK